MNTEELKQIQLSRQYITKNTSKKTVIRTLCGIQCQFLSNAVHSLIIRCNEKISNASLGDDIIKNWTIRGTLHMILEEDLPLFKYDDGFYLSNSWLDEFSGGRMWITGERKKYFADYIVKSVAAGIEKRDDLRLACREGGMTSIEESYIFDSWGGLLRPLCERGFIQYKVKAEKAFKLSKPYIPMKDNEAAKQQMMRYLNHIAPATVNDISYFFGFTKKYVKELLSELPVRTIMIDGKQYFYMGDIYADCPDIPGCIFLAGFDQLMLGYQKKESIYFKTEYLRNVFNLAGIVMPCVLLRGNAAGTWKKKNGNLEIICFRELLNYEKESIEQAAILLWNDIKAVKYNLL